MKSNIAAILADSLGVDYHLYSNGIPGELLEALVAKYKARPRLLLYLIGKIKPINKRLGFVIWQDEAKDM